MKTTKQLFVIIALFYSAVHVFAIEGLTLTIQNRTNAVLTWPSIEGEDYIVQYRATLGTNDAWQTLTNYYPAFSGTNETTFIHVDAVCYPPVSEDGGGGGGGQPPSFESFSSSGSTQSQGSSSPPLPPSPWDSSSWNSQNNENFSSLDSESFDESGSGTNFCAGFYQVVREGVYFFGITNDVILTGITNLIIEAGFTEGTLQTVTLTSDGTAVEDAETLALPFNTPLTFILDTRRLQNGVHTLQARGTWMVHRTNVWESPFVEIFGQPITVNVTNQIFYPDWVDEVGDNLMLIKVSSAYLDFDWQVDIFGATNNYIRSFFGNSTNGPIDIAWDLVDIFGAKLTNDTMFYSDTTITPGVSFNSITQRNPVSIKRADNYPDQGKWVVASLDFLPHNATGYSLWSDAMNSIAQMGEQGGGVLPTTNRNWGEPFVIQTGPTATNTPSDWTTLLFSGLTNREVRNFYYSGHGSPDSIGDEHGGLSSALVSLFLNNNKGSTNANHTRYRFVWLDGCQTANGTWPRAFGLGMREDVPLESYTTRPGAFCGSDRNIYAYTIGPSGFPSIKQSASYYRSNFAFHWRFNTVPGLRKALERARLDAGYNEGLFIKVYGYWGLGWSQYNTKPEWP
ncbi:MAG: hypothetical protein H0X66_15425 [Verrucomicrobia bacterium]|nr:hypothetical protein [Verrucomicrobiota bacterium]